jgi:hypothetical protein
MLSAVDMKCDEQHPDPDEHALCDPGRQLTEVLAPGVFASTPERVRP